MNEEKLFPDNQILLSTTDVKSYITYANKDFCDIAGYSLAELQGQTHNIVRHPDMPKAAFADLWQYTQSGKSWMGPVKNQCKNGDYYWVNAFVTPIKNQQDEVFEYQSIRTKPDREVVERAEQVYKKINQGKLPLLLKFTIDLTLWFQVFFIAFFLYSLYIVALTDISSLISLPMLCISSILTALFYNWRKKFKKLIQQAKSVFDNPLMGYIYSGNNNAISAITLALNMREAELKAIVGRVCDVSDDITKTAKESAQSGANISKILTQQNNETEQVATAMNEMSATIQDLALVIDHSAQSAKQGLASSHQGQQIVEENINANDLLAKQLNEVELAISRLTNASQSIETVLNEISGIADQTNLLALNAAIEAARAGEHGRGFAVVADEVRALAMRTQQSTSEINKLLGQLQSESKLANTAMKKGVLLSDNCVQLYGKTGEALEDITSQVHELSNLNIQIATAIEEQSLVSEEINRNIVAISDMSKNTEIEGQNSVQLSTKLLRKLEQQQALVTQFI